MKKKTKNLIKISIVITVLILFAAFWFCLPSPLFDTSYSTTVYDRNGELLGARVSQDGQWRFPKPQTLPENYVTALITYEDRFFYWHKGVNPASIARAFWQNVKAKKVVSGASTITMQTVRMARNQKRNVFQKIIEIIMATRLELTNSKEEILILYATHAPFGGNVAGIDAASWRYFGHSSETLSWAQAALLAVLPNAPSAMHIRKNRDALLKKRNALLTKLYHQNKMDELTWQLAMDEPLPSVPYPLPQIAPHVVSNLQTSSGGQKHVTTIDATLQIKVEHILKRWYDEFSHNKINNIAAVVLDVANGEVITYCGNVNFETRRAGTHVDIVRAPRSSGSILKPFLYMTMLSEGELLPNMLVSDIPIIAEGFQPQNYHSRFDGAVPASRALSRSLNLPAVSMLRQYGIEKFLNDLRKLGFTTFPFNAERYGLTLILGGGEVTLFETSIAYLRMAQSILFNDEPQTRDVFFDWGQLPVFSSQDAETFNAGAAWQTFEALIHVSRPDEIDWQSIPSMRKVAWKTGTSYGFRDAWAVGVTPEYVVGVWTGNASGEGRPGLTGTGTSAQVMFDIFNVLGHTSWFETPQNAFNSAQICKISGHLAGRHCEETEVSDIIPAGFRTRACPYHSVVHLSANERYRVYANCYPAANMVRRSWFILPPVNEWYYRRSHPSYKTLPPLAPACAGSFATQRQMEFIYPSTNNALRLSRQLDGRVGALSLELAHRQPNAIVYWHIGDTYLGSTQYFHQMSITPTEGSHLITVVDEFGNTLSRNIEIRQR